LAQLVSEASSCRCLLCTAANRCLHVAMLSDGTAPMHQAPPINQTTTALLQP
jgi:hypothetical protein